MGGSSSQTIGYKYFLGMHMVICHSSTDSPVDEVQLIQVGDRTAWSGSLTSNTTLFINNPDLFGGEKKEGGIKGYVDVMFGGDTQAKNPYLVSQLGPIIPAFRGVLSLVLKKVYVCAMSPYPKAWAVKVKRIAGKNWYPSKANISGSANAAHIIYEVLTNPDWGMGYSNANIGQDSFKKVADTLYSEGLGLSFYLTSTDSIESFIYTILQHVNGVFYTNPSTGAFELKLLRNDYTKSALPLYDESNISKLDSFERATSGEMVNEIVVKFRPQGTDTDDTVTVQDLASIQSQQGVVSQTVNYPGIDSYANAYRVAMRDLRQKSTPLARVRMKVNRKAWNVTVGDCIRFSWAEHGISEMVLRVLSINTGSLTEGEIDLTCVEDVFGLPSGSYVSHQPSQWMNPQTTPQDSSFRRIIEAPYWSVARSTDQANFELYDANSVFLHHILGQPTQASVNFQSWLNAGAGYVYEADGSYAPRGTLSSAVDYMTTAFTLSPMYGEFSGVTVGDFALLEDEILRVDAFNTDTGVCTFARGCLDTVPAKHASGKTVYFVGPFGAHIGEEHAPGETLSVKALPRTGVGLLPIATATADTITTVGRFGKPYGAGKVQVNGAYYPSRFEGAFTLSWAHRDRTQQLTTVTDFTAGNIGPETGVTYSLSLYNEAGTLVKSLTGLTGTSYTWSTEAADSGLYSVGGSVFTRNWNDSVIQEQTLYGNTSPAQSITTDKKFKLVSAATTDAKSKFVGIQDTADFDVEFDVVIPAAGVDGGLAYRTTSWQNANDTFGYFAGFGSAYVYISRGSNSTNSSYAELIGGVAHGVLVGATARIRIVVVGQVHKYYVNGVLKITLTNSLYTAAGGIALRVYNATSGVLFDNFTFTPLTARTNAQIRAVLKTVRDGIECLQPYDFTAVRIGYGTGYGYNYGGPA